MSKNTPTFVDLGKTWRYPYGYWPAQLGFRIDNLSGTSIFQTIHSNIPSVILLIH